MDTGVVGPARKGLERSEGLTYQEVLDLDSKQVPPVLREQRVPDIGTDPVPVSRYTDPAFFRTEVEKVWLKVWQWACREEDIPKAGDHTIYEVVGKSLLIVRQDDGSIKAFANSCLHRGRKLAQQGGCKQQFRCMYHGWTWNKDGSFVHNPIAWDFPQAPAEDLMLPEVQVGTWGGFVFINFDPKAKPLTEVLGPLPRHFERWQLENKYKWNHVAKVIPANWKAVSEAFMESHHSITTHPQILPYLADENSQYDILSDYVTRHISAGGVPSPSLDGQSLTEDEILNSMFDTAGRFTAGAEKLTVPEGQTARSFGAELVRQAMAAEDGHNYDEAADCEMLDAILYNVFPNMSFWAGMPPSLVYRWRPWGNSHEHTLMEVIRLKRVPKGKENDRPKPVEMRMLGDDEPWTNASDQLGASLAGVFDQDMANLPYVQEGLNASLSGTVHFGRYSEMRIRQHHKMLEKYLAAED
jgi:phenylpropionate dioxygenase-like ring-hydroxylating dioxygenase large terminal subunit